MRLLKGKRSAWFAPVEGEEPVCVSAEEDVCLVCTCRRGRGLPKSTSAWCMCLSKTTTARCAAVGRGRGLPDVHMSKRSAWCLRMSKRTAAWCVRLSKGKLSGWCAAVEGEEVCLVCIC